MKQSKLAILGGPKAISNTPDTEHMFHWPIITNEDEEAALRIIRAGTMSGTEETMLFEKEFAAWQGTKYALGFSSGTASLHGAMFACHVGVGDEIICPSMTYWASALPAFSLGATVNFADIDAKTLCIDPNDIEHRINERTKAIIVVHYCGHPADMDSILKISRKYNIKVIEDVSHAHGALYKGQKVGTFGDVAAMSLMSGKALAVGEAGILVTDDLEIYERALAFGHYERYNASIQTPSLKPFCGLPLGGYKYRMHQVSSAVGRVQLRSYDARAYEIRRAMNYFWDLLDDVPGIRAHRVPKNGDSTMGGWYAPCGFLDADDLGGLSVTRFMEALHAEGFPGYVGCNEALHIHPLFNTCDVYGHGKPTVIANTTHDVRQGIGSLPVSERINMTVYSVPWFKHFEPEIIEMYANAFRKVALQYQELLPGDTGNPQQIGGWHLFRHNAN